MYESLKESWLVQELMQEKIQEVREAEELKLQLKLQEVRKEAEEVRKEAELKVQQIREAEERKLQLKLQEVRKEAEEVRKEAGLKLQEVELKLKELQREKEAEREAQVEQQQRLQDLRDLLLAFIERRCSDAKLLRIAKRQVALIDDARILQSLLLKVDLAQTPEKAKDCLVDWPDPDEE